VVAVDGVVAALRGAGVAVVAATRDDDLRAEITRGWGPCLSDDGRALRVCLSATPDSRTLANLRANGEIAITFTRPTTYRSVQIKGTVRELAEPTAEELARTERHLAAFVDEAAQVGVPRAICERFAEPPFIAVTIAIGELYDQTPGARAGAPL
jgi:flavin reductase (DIM6/NTAB) family NADH-FMN oxidoreductase RutF